MKLEILVSTMNNDKRIFNAMNINTNCLVINQCNENNFEDFEDLNYIQRIIHCNERGLSKSRNLALKNSKADICVLSDDDMKYVDDVEEVIVKEFEKNEGFDILIFHVERDNSKKIKFDSEKKINFLTSMKCSSVEIAFRRKSILKNNIGFNELLGAGSIFCMGEENDFLFKCLKKGLKIKYIPKKIADLKNGDSSWFDGYNEKYFIGRGGSFTAMSDRMSLFLIFQFAIRKYKIYKNECTLSQAFKFMIKGKKLYLNNRKI